MARGFTLSLFVAFALLGVTLGGCGDEPAQRLVGAWTIDTESFKEGEAYKSAPDAMKKTMDAAMKVAKMDVAFTATTIKRSLPMGEKTMTQESQYVIKSVDGDKVVLLITASEGAEEELALEFQGDRLVMGQPGESFTLRRK